MLQAPPIGNQKPGIIAMALPSAGPAIEGKLFNISHNVDNECKCAWECKQLCRNVNLFYALTMHYEYIPDFSWSSYMIGKHVASEGIFLASCSLESTQRHGTAGLRFLIKKEVV